MKMLSSTPDLEAAALRSPRHRAAFRILTWFISRGAEGGTTDECEGALDLTHQTASPRINELARAGCLVLTEERRLTRSGKAAGVYRYVEGASFTLFLGLLPSPRGERKAGLSPREQTMLVAAKSYVIGRSGAKSEEQAKKLMVELIRVLNGLVPRSQEGEDCGS